MQRNISSQYYYRMLGTQKKELVESEMKELTAPYQNDKLEFINNPCKSCQKSMFGFTAGECMRKVNKARFFYSS